MSDTTLNNLFPLVKTRPNIESYPRNLFPLKSFAVKSIGC